MANRETTKLHAAALRGDLGAVERLVGFGGCNLDDCVPNPHGDTVFGDGSRGAAFETALHAASHTGSADVVALLLRAGALGNKQDSNGCTPLHAACRADRAAVVDALLAAPAAARVDAAARGRFGWTPLHCACMVGAAACARRLLRALPASSLGALDEFGDTPCTLAARNGHGDVTGLKSLMANGGYHRPSGAVVIKSPEHVRVAGDGSGAGGGDSGPTPRFGGDDDGGGGDGGTSVAGSAFNVARRRAELGALKITQRANRPPSRDPLHRPRNDNLTLANPSNGLGAGYGNNAVSAWLRETDPTLARYARALAHYGFDSVAALQAASTGDLARAWAGSEWSGPHVKPPHATLMLRAHAVLVGTAAPLPPSPIKTVGAAAPGTALTATAGPPSPVSDPAERRRARMAARVDAAADATAEAAVAAGHSVLPLPKGACQRPIRPTTPDAAQRAPPPDAHARQHAREERAFTQQVRIAERQNQAATLSEDLRQRRQGSPARHSKAAQKMAADGLHARERAQNSAAARREKGYSRGLLKATSAGTVEAQRRQLYEAAPPPVVQPKGQQGGSSAKSHGAHPFTEWGPSG